MENLEMKYDSICYHIFNGVKNLSNGAKRINFIGFDYKDEEHLFVLAVTMACSSLLGDKEVSIDGPMGARRRLAAKYKKITRIIKNVYAEEKQINTIEFLEGLRPYAKELCGEDFTFADIYRAYYKEGK